MKTDRSPAPILPTFEGFPYLLTQIIPTLYHITLLPKAMGFTKLRDLARRQTRFEMTGQIARGVDVLERLTVKAKKEQRHFAAIEALKGAVGVEAEMKIASGEAGRKWQQEQEQVYAAYNRLRREGSHREALHRLKAESGDLWTVTLLEDTIQKQGAEERRQQRAELQARIQRRAKTLTQKEIAEQEGLTLNQVKWALKKDAARGGGHEGRSRASRAL